MSGCCLTGVNTGDAEAAPSGLYSRIRFDIFETRHRVSVDRTPHPRERKDIGLMSLQTIQALKAVKQMNPMKYADDSACTMTWEERNDNGTCTANY